ncbi:uncharacterized protein [Ptychodera flava]|uniref:uncharacterized protein n=1 Tax=Ptychodera flava TaxID=63121 RepID=UPI00396A04AD
MRRWPILIVLVCSCLATVNCQVNCSYPKVGQIPGEVVLGLEFPFYGGSSNGMGCDPSTVPSVESIQRLEAAMYAVRQLNTANTIPGVSIGLEARDSCFLPFVAWQRNVDYLSETFNNLDVTGEMCSADLLRPGQIIRHNINLNNAIFRDGENYRWMSRPTRFKAEPSHRFFAETMIDILKKLKWRYISIVYSEPQWSFAMLFSELAIRHEICIAVSRLITANESDIASHEEVVRELISKPDAKGVVLFLDDMDLFFTAVENSPEVLAKELMWMIPNIDYHEKVLNDHFQVTRGAVGVAVPNPGVADFLTYFRNLDPGDFDEIADPWIADYWQTKYQCDLPGSDTYGRSCNQGDINDQVLTETIPGLVQVMNSVRAIVEAVKIAHARICGTPFFCPELTNVSATELSDYMMEVDFIGYGAVRVKFDEDGSLINPVLDIINFRREGGDIELLKVGDTTTFGDFDVDTLKLWPNGVLKHGSEVPSRCRNPCRDENCFKGSGSGSGSGGSGSRSHVQGDILIGGMFGIHEHGGSHEECGKLDESAVARLEAMLFAVDRVNRRDDVLPNLSLGAVGMDSCLRSQRVKEEMLSFLGSADYSRGGAGVLTSLDGHQSYIMGTMGASSSSLSMDMNEITRITMVPQVAYSATSPLLSDREMFPNFFRTAPSDLYQAKAMIQVAQYLGWKYVQTVNSEGAYGSAGVEALKRYAVEAGICIANSLVIKDSRDNEEMNKTINGLLSRADARGLLLFTSRTDSRALLAKFHQHGLQGNFSIIASDGWGMHSSLIHGFESEAAGTVILIPENNVKDDFKDYFVSLNPDNNERNPWFKRYWMDKFECNLPGESSSYATECLDSLVLKKNDADADYVSHVIKAVDALVDGIHALYQEKCPEMTGMCAELRATPMEELVEILRHSSEFFDHGDGVPIYDIINIVKTGDDAYGNFKVGQYKRRHFDITETIVLYGPNEQAIEYRVSGTGVPYPSECSGYCWECGRREVTFSHVDGDIDVPVMFGISEMGNNPLVCGAVSDAQVINVEAVLYALDKVNDDPNILSDVQLGVTIVDTCSSPQRGSTVAMLALSGASVFGNQPGDIMATIGALLSGVTKEMLRVTGAVQKTQVSFGSTSIELENDELYPFFLRTIPVDDKQAEAMVSILLEYRWFYVSTVRSNSTYGLTGMEAFLRRANAEKICAATELTIPKNPTSEDYVDIIADLSSQGGTKGANVVVLFTSHEDTRELLKHARARAPTKFTWVAPDSWGIYNDVVEGVLEQAKGSFTVVPFQEPLPDFVEHMRSLTPDDNPRNPWFRHLWESVLDCKLDETSPRIAEFCEDSRRENFSSIGDTRLKSALSAYVINAVLAIAKGLDNLHRVKCAGHRLCPAFYEADPNDVFEAIRNVQLVDEAAGGRSFSFLGDSGEAKYTIMNYVSVNDTGGNGVGVYRKVGHWYDGELTVTGQVQHYDYDGYRIPDSVKSACPDACRQCYAQGVSPIEVPEQPPLIFHGDSIWAVIVIAVIALGVLFCFIIFMYFLIEFRHPVVRGASSSLSFFLLLGISLLLLENFAFMFDPTQIVCGCRRFGLSFFHALIWCALLCKVIRVLRIGERAEINSEVAYIGPWSQTCLLLAFLLVQVVLVGEWLLLDPPSVYYTIIETGIDPPFKLIYHCSYDNTWMILSLVYVFLILLCTFCLACKARKYSSLLNEGAYILFVAVASILIMVTWILVYTLAERKYQNPALCIGITTNAVVVLAAIFVPKITALTSSSEKPQDNAATGNDMGKSYVYSNPDVNKDDELTSF